MSKIKPPNNWSDKVFYILSIVFLIVLTLGVVYSKYKNYHAKMHSAPTWGVVSENQFYPKTGWRTVYVYVVEGKEYSFTTQTISSMHLGDSVLVYYDTTNVKKAFLLTRNSNDAETAFFKSEERVLGLKWQNNLKKAQNELEQKRQSHRERRHFYDYFCQDDWIKSTPGQNGLGDLLSAKDLCTITLAMPPRFRPRGRPG